MSKRAVTAVTAAATAAVLLSSGGAYACSIRDFTAKATCDTSTGEARAAITVTDKDPSGTPADITVRMRMAVGTDGETVGTGKIDHPTAAGASTTILVPWLQGYQWNVSVTAGDLVDERLTDLPISPDTPCSVATSHPSGTPTATASPAPGVTPKGSVTPTATAVVPAASTSPAPSTSAASPVAGTGLAETGGGSGTALIVGSAAAAIAAGAGVLFVMRRRTAPGRK
ncbi:LAETG motif-containing sortase-dependent surface protein [Streptomyces tropicalis]|uniref:LAETG motif-containing sortase-dependent surface protein n=1 Tax=Streptomyces tropicalis TaxID=3034234 RepID=A0ABT5ZZS3_9ACTN|nr:LAETG motif-containing sortase-dependent surface protein [Streptomyces tropicalis]MDF3297893.1 LAETG motif-containing sortase-dependent surface protein [Streptomyces tropicalis]